MRNFQILLVSIRSKSVNNVCKLLQLLEDLTRRFLTAAVPMDPTGGLPSPRPLDYSPKIKIPGATDKSDAVPS